MPLTDSQTDAIVAFKVPEPIQKIETTEQTKEEKSEEV